MDCNSIGDTRDIAMAPKIAIPPIEIPEREKILKIAIVAMTAILSLPSAD